MTIKKVKQLKAELDTAILKLLTTFETTTGVKTGYVDILRKRDQEEEEGQVLPPVAYSEDRGPIVNANVKLNLDI